MQEEILTLARTLSGAGEDEETALALLCAAAEKEWAGRLRDGVEPEECREAFLCAAALFAAAGLSASRSELRFTAGDVSVTEPEGRKSAETMHREAERLMEPYVAATERFCFRGVRG